jgi:glycosyltransferase involved in cell wall biosynthesis
MRVALLSHNAQAGDAIGNQLAEKLAFFLDRGADVRVFVESERHLHPSVRAHCRLVASPEPSGEGWQFITSADLVVVEYGQYYPMLDLVPLLAGGKPRVLLDYHGVTPPEFWGSHNREGLENGLRQRGLVWCADAAVAHSHFTARELSGPTNFPDQRLHVLSHPLDLGRFAPARPRLALRDRLKLENAFLLLFVGRIAPNKRLPVLIEAVHNLRGVSPEVHAVIIGDGGDAYASEFHDCRQLTTELAIEDRVRFLGRVSEEQLLDAYADADLLVMPSLHEGFCIPVAEAMGCGLPVIASRSAAIPETVAGAGLTFEPNDAADLARQIRRALGHDQVIRADGLSQRLANALSPAYSPSTASLRVAVVSFRYGCEIVGGAEASLRRMASALRDDGHGVEVFTTCTRSESTWTNELPEGRTSVDGIPVHRFAVDPHDRTRHLESVRAILQTDGPVTERVEREYIRHSIHSARLVDALGERMAEFDAVIVGPYLFGLTYDIASAFPEKTILVPCFHDEPLAQLRLWRPAYENVGGILYHSPEEKSLAELELGIHHPGAVCLGTNLDVRAVGNADRGRSLAKTSRPYLVYCGRYSQQKNLPLLLDYAQRYQQLHPDRFAFVFMGDGNVIIPNSNWARDLGFVDEQTKCDVLAGAAALVQLSHFESLSLVALEAWIQETPVIADHGCRVLTNLIGRSGGGRAIDSFAAFTETLDDLWQRPELWQELGRQGRRHAETEFGDATLFTKTLVDAIRDLRNPLRDRMRAAGLRRAAEFDRKTWREQFGRIVEELLDNPPQPFRELVTIVPRVAERTVSLGQDSTLIPVRVRNDGTHGAVAGGPARILICSMLVDEFGQPCDLPSMDTPLPKLLTPGEEVPGVVRVPVPTTPGNYRLGLYAEYCRREIHASKEEELAESLSIPSESWVQLVVTETASNRGTPMSGCLTVSLETVQAALAEAERRGNLPDEYTDVTEGVFAGLKKKIKAKVLGNFKHAYVDVLSRQQSAFNRHVLAALQELLECCAMLDHARTPADPATEEGDAVSDQTAKLAGLVKELTEELIQYNSRLDDMEDRLARLEAPSLEQERLAS